MIVLRLLTGVLALTLVGATARAQTPDSTVAPDPCVAALDAAEAHYVAADFAAAEQAAAPCAGRVDAPTSARVRGYRLLALTFLRQELYHDAQVALLQLVAVDPGYQPDPVQDPPLYVSLVTSIQAQLQRASAAAAPRPTTGPVVSVNTATEADLDAVPGIGPVLAQRIVAYRAANGPFRSVDDLVNVSGIGPRTLERLAPYLTTAPTAGWRSAAAGGVASDTTAAPPVALAAPIPPPAPPMTAPPSATARVNINTATAEELDTLPGVGPAIAQRILDFRAANGPFRSVEMLVEVSGIGPRTLERLRPFVTVGDD